MSAHCIDFISPHGWLDPAPAEFQALVDPALDAAMIKHLQIELNIAL